MEESNRKDSIVVTMTAGETSRIDTAKNPFATIKDKHDDNMSSWFYYWS